jgi:Dolichyl-phosphate-mannose-protein mannosyltransferase
MIRRHGRAPLRMAAPILILAFLFQSYSASRMKSPVMDEPTHIAAGLSYVQTGIFRLNAEHPPLLKELAGLSLRLSGVRWPRTTEASLALGAKNDWPEWQLGNSIIEENGGDKVLFWSRLPLIIVSVLGGVLLYLFGRELVGEIAALGALLLYAFDPTIIAHSFLVTTDVGMAVFTLLFLWALWSYLRRPGWTRLVVSGVALGLALSAKFSAVFLILIGAVLALAALRWPAETANESSLGFFDRPSSGDSGWGRKIAARGCGFAMICVAAAAVIDTVYFSLHGISLYNFGLHRVYANHNPIALTFVAGRLYPKFHSYLAACYFLKEPLAGIALFGIGLYELRRTKNVSMLRQMFLLVPLAILYVGYMVLSENLGIRYLIPILPFVYLIGGLGLQTLLRNGSTLGRAAAVLICAWIVFAAAGIYPDHLAYFNESACLLQGKPGQIGFDGGTSCGPLWLADSNVDWGQGLKQLGTWLENNAHGRSFQLGYFGTYPPEAYGISYQPLNVPELLRGPKPGLYVLSTHLVAFLPAMRAQTAPGYGQWLRRLPPTAVIGHSFYVYDIPPSAATGSTLARPPRASVPPSAASMH